MNGIQILAGLLNRLVLLLLVLGGIYLSLTSVNTAIISLSGGDGSDLDAIVLGLVALVVVIGMAIGGHFITKGSTMGWRLLAAITPLLIATGALVVRLTPWGAVLVSAGAPCLLLLMHPAKVGLWASASVDVDDGARLSVVLGASGAVILVVFDRLSFSPCPYTFLGLALGLAVAGIYLLARAFIVPSRSSREERQAPEPRHVADVHPAIATTAFFGIFSWGLCTVIFILAMKQLAVLSSFGTSLGAVTVAILSAVAFAVGCALVAVLATVARKVTATRLAAIACLATLGTCTATLTLASQSLGSTGIVIVRLLAFFSIPGALLGMVGNPVPDVKGTAFHFWKVFMAVCSIVLLIVGVGFKIANADAYFLLVYLATLAVAAVPEIIPLVHKGVVEVQEP